MTHRVGQPGCESSPNLLMASFFSATPAFKVLIWQGGFAWEQRCFWGCQVSTLNLGKCSKKNVNKKSWGPASKIRQILYTACWGSIYLGDSRKKNEISLEPEIHERNHDPWKHRNPVHSCWYPTDFRLKFSSQHLLKGIIGPPLFFDLCESRRSWCTLPRTNISRPWK